jgi:hypothetical protein
LSEKTGCPLLPLLPRHQVILTKTIILLPVKDEMAIFEAYKAVSELGLSRGN